MEYLLEELENILQKRNSDLNTLFDTLENGYWYWDLEIPENKWMSAAFWKTLGYNPDEVENNLLAWQPLLSKADLHTELSSVKLYLDNPDKIYENTYSFQHKNKNKVWIKARGKVTTDANGKAIRVLGTFHDITTQKQKENDLQFYEQIIEGADIGTWKLNLQNGEYTFNSRNTLFLGYKLSEISKVDRENWRGVTHPDDLKNIDTNLNAYLKGKTDSLILEYRLKHKNGNWVWIEGRGKIVSWTKDGKPLLLSGSNKDITNRKQKEEKLVRYKELLKKAKKIARIGTWEVNLTNETVEWDEVTKDIYEAPPNFIREYYGGLDSYKKGYSRTLIKRTFRESIKNEKEFDIEVEINTLKGNEKWIRLIGFPIIIDGKCVSLFGIIMDIDEKTKAVKKLKFEEERFRGTFENAANGMAIVGLDGTFLKVNKSLSGMLGYKEKDLLKMCFQEITHPEDLDKDLNYVKDLIQGNITSYSMEKRYLHKSGNLIWAKLSVSLAKDEKGEPIHFVSQITDITKEKEASFNLEKSECRFKEIFNSAFQFVAFLDTDGHIIELNETALKFANVSAEEVKGIKLSEAKYWKTDGYTHKKIKQGIRKAATGELVKFETIVRGNKGIETTLDFSIKPVLDHTGKVVSLIAEGRPIQEMVNARNRLAKINNQLKGILDASVHVGIIETDLKGNITLFNKGAENLLGYKAQEIVKQNLSVFLPADEIKANVLKIRKDKSLKLDDFNIVIDHIKENPEHFEEWNFIRKDKSKFPGILIHSLIFNSENQIIGTLGIVTDLTEIKKAEKEIKELHDVTKDQNERLINFAHIVSHNLRSHSRNLYILLQMLKESHPEIIKSEYFPLIMKGSGNLKETINHLTEIVAINTNTLEKLETLNLSEYISKAMNNINGFVLENQCSIKNNVKKNIEVQAIPAYLESILLNFLTNSIKYRSSKRDLKIDINSNSQKGYIEIQIKDNGLGIDLKTHGAKLFGLYKTFHGNKDARGIGLFITKNQIEAMGGKIEVESEVNKGTTFKVFLKEVTTTKTKVFV